MRYNCLIACMYSVYCNNIVVKLYGDYWSMFYKEMLFQALYLKMSLLIQYVLCNYLYNLQANSELKVTPSNVFQWRNNLQLSRLSTKKHNKRRKRMVLKLSNNNMGKLTLCWILHWFIKSIFSLTEKKTVWFSDIRYKFVIFESRTPVHTHTWIIFYCKQSESELSVNVKWLWRINITKKKCILYNYGNITFFFFFIW